jgi:integrase/recombinase XerC
MARELDCPPDEITTERLLGWFGSQQHWETETRRGYRNSLRSFYAWAYRSGRISANIADALPQVRASKPLPRPAPEDVWEQAVQTAESSNDRRLALMLRLASHGLRRGEVARVHVRDLTWSSSGPLLLVHGKGGKKRTLPISLELAEGVAQGAAGHTPGLSPKGFLFPGSDEGHLSPRWVGRLCARILPGIWTMHTLRHRAASRAFRKTRNLRAVQRMLGHESVATTEIYTFVDDDEVREAIQAAVR